MRVALVLTRCVESKGERRHSKMSAASVGAGNNQVVFRLTPATAILYAYSLIQIFIVSVFTVSSVPIICPRLSLSLSLSVRPTVKDYFSKTMGWIMMKLVESI